MEEAAKILFSEDDFGRAAVLHALQAVWSFLHVRGLSGQAMAPIRALMLALEGVGRGNLPELFDPHALGPDGRPRRKWSHSAAAEETKVAAAALMEVLMKRGMTKPEAARAVARSASDWRRVSTGVIKATTVANWRDEILQSAPDDASRKQFQSLFASLTEGPRAAGYAADLLASGPLWIGGFRAEPET